MEEELKDNANPTILQLSDLPSRRRDEPSKKRDAARAMLFEDLVPSYPDPFSSGLPSPTSSEEDAKVYPSDDVEEIDEQEIYDLIAHVSDPEHPLTLGQLAVVNLPDISIQSSAAPSKSRITTARVLLTPTISHCSLATVIGLGVRVRLEQALPPRFRVDVRIKEGTHSTADAVNKQLGDKERVAAALENRNLMGVIGKMLEGCT
ncbi:putative cytoplasmic protein required for cell viability [Viridothelium virens]|uniref:Putative cytoplasmic protein required for cell viability n=1 Tax=Viridothelium virens TaxID=1048519 RepID=A0A6A6GSY6_VIRVR|nr:putative cytoplasmic protein required for cell viability [Viridothelium virens]